MIGTFLPEPASSDSRGDCAMNTWIICKKIDVASDAARRQR